MAASAMAAALVLAACGSTSSGSSSSGGGGDPAEVAAATKVVAAAYKGTFKPPPTSGPAAVKGKSVWWLSCGSQFEACNDTAGFFKDAGKMLGWKVTVFDTKGDPTVAAAGIRQAIAARADGIAGQGQDCTGITSALQAAKAADIPFTSQLASDCSTPLFSAPFDFGGYDTEAQWTNAWASTKAAYFVSKLGGDAKIINLALTNLVPTQEINKDFLAGFKAKCSACDVTAQVDFTSTDIPVKMLAKVQAALTQHPDADALAVPFDSLMGLGLVPLIQRAGRDLKIVGGGEGSPSNIDLIRQGKQTFALAFPYEWLVWAQADNMNRLLAGQQPVQQGGGFQFVDKTHNLPKSGPYVPSFDFKSTYEKVWAGS